MRFWFREVAGWVLVVIGLWTFLKCYDLLERRLIFEAGPVVFIGVVVFRGGIHLLKVAVAARICREARERTRTAAPATPPRRPAAGVNPLVTRGS